MPVAVGRPPSQELRIDDCSSVKVFDNPAPQCPHGLSWRESDYEEVNPKVKALMCKRDACEAIEYHPHAEKHIVLKIPRSFMERQPLTELYTQAITAGFSATIVSEFGQRASVVGRMKEIISKCVLEWGWTDNEGEILPLPSVDWDAVSSVLEQSEFWWIIRTLLAGGDPNAAAATLGNSEGT